ncbi:DUF2075 domain-containing protein [Photobacterium damselae subsp. piscicida]|uniref:AAA family ATPase n=2 Tax=Photobacterium damselae TaxID=38293 RepID=A0A1Q9GYJ9_PHODP|nr:AAA family ATPase [Photobacterium damselae]MBE8130171.1 AAA family ATPase [Photobacterium damselae subsp. piscicida]OLQ80211.1 general secretion pathway protein GspA [Photobacterium damselae subsp. piscicida]PSV71418.1 DUF2075 domain-containing protein [Photobacterium damselae]PSW77322.1 DUF2075 domain-containing protein [Photobacterium damselae]QOD52346.1 AAA family ATPase [Photobacterium damselae subsp. piscicida]
MYKDFFGISEAPFSIVPSARFLFLSERHREALTHMLFGVTDGGGFGLLTGEVGTGKTTVLRAMIARLSQETQVAVVLNPALSAHELLAAICDEFALSYTDSASLKQLSDLLHQHLLANHSEGKQTLLLVDEAQHLMPEVLEQLRLLTNLETDSRKLLKVVLIGQPELQQLLQQERLRQLAQRITSRYHLLPLTVDEVGEYIRYRLRAVGCHYDVFDDGVIRYIAKETQCIPRLINLICDKSMQLAHHQGVHQVTKAIAEQACEDVLSWQVPINRGQVESSKQTSSWSRWLLLSLLGGGLAAGAWFATDHLSLPLGEQTAIAAEKVITTDTQLGPMAKDSALKLSSEQRLDTAIKASYQQRQAMQTLYQLWGFDTALNQATCATSSRVHLTCYSGKGSLTSLAMINRPVIVKLQDAHHHDFYAVLYAVTHDQVQLLLGHERIAVPPSWFEQRWDGNYQLLWRPPFGDDASIRYGQQGPRVAWLNQQLNTFLGESQTNQNYFDQGLVDKLRRFQRSQSLNADGIAGKQTLMVLDSALNLPGPTLQPEGV